MKKYLPIILAIVAVVAIVFAVVFAVQKGDVQKQNDALTQQVATLEKDLATAKADIDAVKAELETVKASASAETAAKAAAEEAAAKAAAEAEAAKAAAEETKKAYATYTYNLSMTDFPTNWNIHQYKTDGDSTIADWITRGFYAFDYNETMDGYKMVPELAAEMPIDVTADYVGEEWGIAEGETARAWKIVLRDNLKWENGASITSEDFIESYKALLNPIAANYRADGLWSGNMVITNAESYAKQGTSSDTAFGAYMKLVGIDDKDAFFAAHGAEKGYINWSNSFGDTYDFATQTWTGAAEDAIVETPLTVAELYTFYTEGAGGEYITWADADTKKAWAMDECFAKYTYPELDWEKVGMKATAPNELVFIITKKLEGFYLYYSLTSNYLVNMDLYKACETVVDGVYNNTYGTSVETTMSYGPYMLTTFQSDKLFTLDKNPHWYGYTLEQNAGLYQTTRIQYDCVKEVETRHEMFLNGQLDGFGLDKNYIPNYATSDYTYYSMGDSVFAMVFNPNLTALTTNQTTAGENINKTIITLKDFRIGMSLAMDRANFCLATQPTNGPALALYGDLIIADPEQGIAYRATEQAKNVIVNFWGLADEVGEGKMYATADDAIDSISGYNLEMAQQYFNTAYDQAIAQGLMDEDDVIQITIGTPNLTSAFYNSGYEYIVNNYTDAVKGTKLEGKLTFTRDGTLGNGFADALRNNQVDMLFGVGWTGSTFDPYGLMQVYVDPAYQYDSAWDANTVTIDIELDGVTYTATAVDWYKSINGNKIEAVKTGTEETAELVFAGETPENAHDRIIVLAALENAILQNYNYIPLMNDANASLKGMQVEFYTEDEVFPMGRGGIRFMTYNYTDAEWNAYVAEQGGTLNYK